MPILSGTALSLSIRTALLESLPLIAPTIPKLLILQHGDNAASASYIRMKLSAAASCGFRAEHRHLPTSCTFSDLRSEVEAANLDPDVHGILIQLPLPLISTDDERELLSCISPEKDVDGFGPLSQAAVQSRLMKAPFEPCTPKGIMSMLHSLGTPLQGLHAVVLGRSDIVGTPLCGLLRRADMTVTQLHRKSKEVEKFVAMADVVVAAVGKAEYVKGEWIKEGAIVIDVGTNFIPDALKKSGQRLVGDVDFESASKRASWITPVPGGVGPMTVASLMQNTFIAAQRAFGAAKKVSDGVEKVSDAREER